MPKFNYAKKLLYSKIRRVTKKCGRYFFLDITPKRKEYRQQIQSLNESIQGYDDMKKFSEN